MSPECQSLGDGCPNPDNSTCVRSCVPWLAAVQEAKMVDAMCVSWQRLHNISMKVSLSFINIISIIDIDIISYHWIISIVRNLTFSEFEHAHLFWAGFWLKALSGVLPGVRLINGFGWVWVCEVIDIYTIYILSISNVYCVLVLYIQTQYTGFLQETRDVAVG